MSTAVVKPVKRSKRQLMERRIQPATVQGNTIALKDDTRRTVNEFFNKAYFINFDKTLHATVASTVIAFGAGFCTAPYFSDISNPFFALAAYVLPITLAPAAAITAVVAPLKYSVRKEKKAFLTKHYGDQVAMWLADCYNIKLSDKDLSKMLTIVFTSRTSFVLTDVNSGEKFKAHHGSSRIKIVTVDDLPIEPQTPNALLKANSGVKESKPVVKIEANAFPEIKTVAEVQRKLDTIASRLKLLEDARWKKNLEDSLSVIDRTLSDLIVEERENTHQLSLSAVQPYLEKTQLMLK